MSSTMNYGSASRPEERSIKASKGHGGSVPSEHNMVPSTLAILASTLIALSPISAKLLRSLPELSTTSYDFIIIGGMSTLVKPRY